MINYSNITTIYVSQKYGQWHYTGFEKEETGNFQGPVDSIENALSRIAELRRAGAGQPITIAITDEVYSITKPLYIRNDVKNITIKGINNTVISGGILIENFNEDCFNGVKCLSAPIPEIDDGLWFTDFYVDSMRADFTFLPKEGFFEAESVENNNTALFEQSKWFIAKEAERRLFSSISNFTDCFISYNHYWVDEHSPVENMDAETGKIMMKYNSRFSISDKNERSKLRYKLENVKEAFSDKNQWYLDRETKKVYYIPRDEKQSADNIKAYAPLTQKLFVIEGEEENPVEYITFENLIFAYTKGDYVSYSEMGDDIEWNLSADENLTPYASDSQAVYAAPGAIEFTYSHGCRIEKCTFRNLGIHACTVRRGCSNMQIYANRFFDLGAGAVIIGGGAYGCRKTNETFGNLISQNIIERIGRRYHAACGILMMHSYSNTVSHNDISDTFYTGVSCGWVWGYSENISRDNIIEKNHIHNIGQGVLSDMGGIYILGTQPGTVIRNNVIHNVRSKHYGGHGIYTDEGTCYILVENNICYENNSTAFNQHYGRMNTLRNNIFVKSEQEPVRSSKEELHISIVLERNIIVSDGTASYRAGYGGKETGFFHKISGNRNLLFNTKGNVNVFSVEGRAFNLEEMQNNYGLEHGSIIADPKFKDYENNDFELLSDSPAFDIGFEPIDVSDIGVTVKL